MTGDIVKPFVKPYDPWLPISTAPKDGTKIDIVAKHWKACGDFFVCQRFTDCFYMSQNTNQNWIGLDMREWCPIYWMPIPELPAV